MGTSLRASTAAGVGLGFLGTLRLIEIGVIERVLYVLAVDGALLRLGALLAGQLVEDAVAPLLRVERGEVADEDGDGPAFGQRLLDQSADGLTAFVVVGADVANAAGVGSVIVHGQQLHLAGDLVEVVLLLLGVDDAHGDGLGVLVEDAVDHLALDGRVALLRPLEEQLNVVLRGGLVRAGLGDGPERFRVVRYERHLGLARFRLTGRQQTQDERSRHGPDNAERFHRTTHFAQEKKPIARTGRRPPLS